MKYFLHQLNFFFIDFTEKYQDLTLSEFRSHDLDMDLVSKHKDKFNKILDSVEQKLTERNEILQKKVCIAPREIYWAISEALLPEDLNFTDKVILMELLYYRHHLVAMTKLIPDLTLGGGRTLFGENLLPVYDKYKQNFGMNDNFFRPEDSALEHDALAPLRRAEEIGKLCDQVDEVIEARFSLSSILGIS